MTAKVDAQLTVQDVIEALVKIDREAAVTASFNNSDGFAVVKVDQDEESGEVIFYAE